MIIKILLTLLIIITLNGYSHSGRTDKDGGHYNRKTGEYHYHGGKSGNGWLVVGGIVGAVILYNFFKGGNKK